MGTKKINFTSSLSIGTHTISCIAKASGYNDSNTANVEFLSDEFEYISNDDETLSVAGTKDGYDSKTIVIPDTYNGRTVTGIGKGAFDSSSSPSDSIASITIPDTVTSIGYRAFSWCESLININFGENSRLKEIGGEAFFRTHISSINLPNSLETIKQGAFKTCTSLSSITIPESVTTIGTVTFENCSSLRTAVIRSSYGLSNLMFDSCSSLRTVTIGSSVKYIGSYVFEDCYNIANINYEGTVEQWNAIEKNSKWQGYWDTHPVTYIQCTDGQVAL